jgi:excinuclease ABC subunit C
LRHFGSVRNVAAASAEEIAGLPGIGPNVATAVLAALHPGGAGGQGGAAEPARTGGRPDAAEGGMSNEG